MNIKLSFRQFLEDQKPRPMNHLDALSDELGINIDDLEKIPQVLANFQVGGKACNLSAYQIMELIRDDNGDVTAARIKIIKDPGNRARKLFVKPRGKESWTKVKSDKDDDDDVYVVTIEKLNQMLTQGLDQMGAAGGGGLPGGGPMGGPMGGLPGM